MSTHGNKPISMYSNSVIRLSLGQASDVTLSVTEAELYAEANRNQYLLTVIVNQL
jgi:hypothetical protein